MALGLNLDDAADTAALSCRRFWLPRGVAPNLSDSGFLVDPESPRTSLAPPALPLDALSDVPVLALLGEPGLGKTTVLKQEASRLKAAAQGTDNQVLPVDLTAYATDSMVRHSIFRSKQFRALRKNAGGLFLLLDGFDTCLQHVETAVALLLDCLKEENCERLFLRIACRTVAWPPDLEQGLRRLWPKTDAVQVFELAPLRRDDVRIYADASGVRSELFLKEVERVGAHQFANRPISLRFLLKLFGNSAELPSLKTDLYHQGCLVLCDEVRDDLRRRRRPNKLSAGLRLAAATRIAAVSVFCRRTAIWTASRGDPTPTGDVREDELLGGQERFRRETVAIEEDGIREALDTGLFRSLGRYRLGFSHQTYAEYLAARYLVEHELPVPKILQLLAPDGSGKVIPQLRETAAWLAALVPEICTLLLSKDPTAIFASDTFPSSRKIAENSYTKFSGCLTPGSCSICAWCFLLAGKTEGA